MNKVEWTYVGIPGQPYRVVVYHSPSKGHLLIQCNGKILLVKFGVKDERVLSFFIEEELVEIHLTKNAQGQFEYEFKINRKVDTAYNLRLRKELRKDKIKMLLVFGAIAAFIISLVALGYWYTQNYRASLLASEGLWVESVALIQETTRGRDYFRLMYTYNHQPHYTRPVYFNDPYFNIEGFALQHGDKFMIKIAESRPDIYLRDSFLLTPASLNEQLPRAAAALISRDYSSGQNHAVCVAEKVYRLHGRHGLAVVSSARFPDARHNPFTKADLERIMTHSGTVQAIRTCPH